MKPTISRFNAPAGYFMNIPDAWKLTGYAPMPFRQFEFEPVYCDGQRTMTESELLQFGVAEFRSQTGKHTQHVISIVQQ